MAFPITDLSGELLHNVLLFVEPRDLSNISKTCKHLHDFVARDDLLWKRIYLTKFDHPLHDPPSWTTTLQDRIRMENILASTDHNLKREQTEFLAHQILSMLLSTKSPNPTTNTSFLRHHFHHGPRKTNASTLLRQSSLFKRCGLPLDEPAPSPYLRQLSARLHVYSALNLELRESEHIDVDGSQYIHPCARSRVYDLRRYKAANYWGPFMDDGSGRVDWEKVQSIYIVLGHGLRMIGERNGGRGFGRCSSWWENGMFGEEGVWEGLGSGSYRSLEVLAREEKRTRNVEVESGDDSSSGSGSESDSDKLDFDYAGDDPKNVPSLKAYMERYADSREARFQHDQAILARQDPYGVKGTWMRVVNFLDYHDLFAYNFSGLTPAEGQERPPISTAEAIRLIILRLWVTKIEWPDEDEGEPDDWETVAESEAGRSPAVSRQEPKDSALVEPLEELLKVDEEIEKDKPMASEPMAGSATASKPALSPVTSEPDNESSTRKGKRPSSDTNTDKPDSISNPRPKKSKYPIVHFAGKSNSLHIRWDPNANSHIRGHVRAYPSPPTPAHEYQRDDDEPPSSQSPNFNHIYSHSHSHSQPSGPHPSTTTATSTPSSSQNPTSTSPSSTNRKDQDLVIRWTTFSVFHGEERWRSEGIQIGGLKSARGILGNWFDKDFDPHGPAGPTGFWKLGSGVEMFERGRRQDEGLGGEGPLAGWDD